MVATLKIVPSATSKSFSGGVRAGELLSAPASKRHLYLVPEIKTASSQEYVVTQLYKYRVAASLVCVFAIVFGFLAIVRVAQFGGAYETDGAVQTGNVSASVDTEMQDVQS